MADHAGGSYVAWLDARPAGGAGEGPGVHLQHLTVDGTVVPGWPPDGVAVSQGVNESFLNMLGDPSGGVILSWLDSGYSIHVQRVTPSGLPYSGWPANGVPASPYIDDSQRSVRALDIAEDGAGGAILVWPSGPNLMVEHVTGAGLPDPEWGSGGIVLGSFYYSGVESPHVDKDGSGGAFVTWTMDSAYCFVEPYQCYDYGGQFRRHVTAMGHIDPAWSAFDAGFYHPRIAADGVGGAFLTRIRGPYGDGNIYAERVGPDGSTNWAVTGLASEFPVGSVSVTSDGEGGTLLLWGAWSGTGLDIYAQRLDASGIVIYALRLDAMGMPATQWAPNGVLICDAIYPQIAPAITTDGGGGAVIAWQDQRNGRDFDIYAQRVLLDQPVPALVSLAGLSATAGGVRLDWYSGTTGLADVRIERREKATQWLVVGRADPDGRGHLVWTDTAVVPGGHYGYRLAYTQGGRRQVSGDTWVDVPRSLMLALEGAHPNPAVDYLNAAFALPSGDQATLDILDIMGRRVVEREVGQLGPGRHVVRLEVGARVPPGLYWLRLSQGGRSLVARAIVIR